MGVADDERFAVVYLGTLKVSFLEAILRYQGNGRVGDWLIEYAELDSWTCAKMKVREPLRLADLRGDGSIRMGIPSDVPRGTGHALSQIWSAAIWSHDMRPDGSSTHRGSTLNGETHVAVCVLSKLAAEATPRLLDCRTDWRLCCGISGLPSFELSYILQNRINPSSIR
ncbi:RES domain-containing protein [Mesorhizobium sp. M7A.F.Ca.US.006.01.1.1]|uniref:RES domain-containing protein n=1 Tax=Mesorhizobium sp. M7A.F.Ca.US.006.01.1.1 TaxID=2496707 RepID=UPI000FC9F4C7|nr:RES domain-containing protein [Mesorhizobium sp. M7A.F.Ca.US.006.01.1.1]RUZ73924.1 RES domain-containing protein [Mesorhizobium sp. M7A.F.Ca.US.006.01.1.1]